MTKHFAVALVAASSLFFVASGNAGAKAVHDLAAHNPGAHHPCGASPLSAVSTLNVARVGETGTASYYGKAHQGRRAASGIRFDQKLLTAAHPWLPFGTKVKVTSVRTGRSVIVTITDRLCSRRRIVDLSMAAARELGMIRAGITEVTLLPV